ncbi:[protein-PII] uridylyltransferase family protein [Crateriforma conspicua]|uniref:[protein-PII] uridylyltransferase family protein n=1 Tax=Crateriforma conspicua TaxID=2527996 RepID=UPI0011A258A0|nr:glutamate-ammonia-ligase adenylyltransferase [Crateriforma conspicua]
MPESDPASRSDDQAARPPSFSSDTVVFARWDGITAAMCHHSDRVADQLRRLEQLSVPEDLLDNLKQRLSEELPKFDRVDAVIHFLVGHLQAARSPTAALALFERDPAALSALLQMFATSDVVAEAIIADPESFDLLRLTDGQPANVQYLVDELVAELLSVSDLQRAADCVRQFAIRETIRVAYGEFAHSMVPVQASAELATVADAMVIACLDDAVRRVSNQWGLPVQVDGAPPEFAAIAMGAWGAKELTYGGEADLILLCQQMDRKNNSHVAFYQSVAQTTFMLLNHDTSLAFRFNLNRQPRIDPDDFICSLPEAIRLGESQTQIWPRLAFVHGRRAGGSEKLADAYLKRIRAGVFRRLLTRSDLTELKTLRGKMERRIESAADDGLETTPPQSLPSDINRDAGGRTDIRYAVRFLQLLHGGEDAKLRTENTLVAIDALEKTGCITHQEASLLTNNDAKLTRLEHQLSVMSGRRESMLPDDPAQMQRLVWQLGLRDQAGHQGDVERFERSLREILQVNRRIINHLMNHGQPEDESVADAESDGEVPIETELILDPNPDPAVVREVLDRYGFGGAQRIMDDLQGLATENSSFLSPRRCRHFFAALAPDLLREIATTPDPQSAMDRLVEIADSIGAKATLWELLKSSPPTLRLMVRLSAGAPYLAKVLTGNPGMIDELVDSLVIDQLPSAERLDQQSISLCRGAVDLDPILRSFKDAAHLTIGVRDMLGKETVRDTHRALADTADAVLRRIVENEQEKLAARLGDPVDAGGDPSELCAVAFGKLGGREPNYHSDLDVLFLYTANGNTQRRVGGPRATTTNQHFFNELAGNVVNHVNGDVRGPGLYDLDSRLRPTDEEGILSVTIDTFARRFNQGVAPLWQRLALCKARPLSGSKQARLRINEIIADVLRRTTWHPSMIDQALQIRTRMSETASPQNFKRGVGGTVDVEMLTQILLLRCASQTDHAGLVSENRATGTLELIAALADDARLDSGDADALSANYQTLRSIEARLRLMDYDQRHEFPDDAMSLRTLAFLMRTDVGDLQQQYQDARDGNRQIFTRLMKPE